MTTMTFSVSFVPLGAFFPVFPCVALAIDGTDVVLLTTVTDQFLRENEMGPEEIQRLLRPILRAGDWKWSHERDASLQRYEITAHLDLMRHFPDHDEVKLGVIEVKR